MQETANSNYVFEQFFVLKNFTAGVIGHIWNCCQLTDKLFKEMRGQYGRLGSLWEKMSSAIDFFIFLPWKYYGSL